MDGKRKCSDFSIKDLITSSSALDNNNVPMQHSNHIVAMDRDHHNAPFESDDHNVHMDPDHHNTHTNSDHHNVHRDPYDHNVTPIERDYHNVSMEHNSTMHSTSEDWEDRALEDDDDEDIEVDVISMNGAEMFSPGSSSGGHSEESNEEEHSSSKNSSTADDDHAQKLSNEPEDLSKKIYACSDCKYVTDRKNNLKRHIVTMHEECQKALECCDEVFPNKAAMREHVIACHKHGYDCKMCGRNFCRKALLKRHITVHSGQKDFICQVCGYATSHKSNLDRHKRRHLPKEGTVMPDKTLHGPRDHPMHMRTDYKPLHMSRDHPFNMRFSHEQMLQMTRDHRTLNMSRAGPLNLSRDVYNQSRDHRHPRLQQQLPHIPYPNPIKTSPNPGEKVENDRLALYLQDRYARFMDGKLASPHENRNHGNKPPGNPLLRFPMDPVLSPQHVRPGPPDNHVTEHRRPYTCNMLPDIHLTNVVCVPPPSLKPPELESASPTKSSSLEDEIEQFTYVVGDKEYLSYPLKKRKRLAPSLYTCKFCDRVFSNQLQLNLHMEESHVIKKPEPQRPLTLSVNTQPKTGVCIFN